MPTHPEQHPHGNTSIAQRVPPSVPEGGGFDLTVLPPELPEPEQLDDLLRSKEPSDREWLRRECTWVGIVDLLHVGVVNRHAVLLTRKVDTGVSFLSCSKSEEEVGTTAMRDDRREEDVERLVRSIGKRWWDWGKERQRLTPMRGVQRS
jgi:hypothetical protein